MRELITCAILPVINEKGMSSERLDQLIYIRDFIDRISSRNYINDEDLGRIEAKYGVMPDIVSWGDFFQAEMATSLQNVPDEEFFRAFETVKFDMISSYLIFKDKGPEFFEWVDNSCRWFEGKDEARLTEEEREILHLGILMEYYSQLAINGNFTDSEMKWHSSFNQARAM